jgi:predicted phosphohydrolase
MKIAWATDIHLNHAPKTKTMFAKVSVYDRFVGDIKRAQAEALFLTGDIAEADSVIDYLLCLDEELQIPIYYVMGNHDYYGGSIYKVREEARIYTNKNNNQLHWMPESGVVELTPEVAVIGVDGWSDGRLGNAPGSPIVLNDWQAIEELRKGRKTTELWGKDFHLYERIPLLQALGDKEAGALRMPLLRALGCYQKVYVLTHVPPWKEATWHQGAHSEDDWLPWFSCKAVGDLIEECAAKHKDREITVLCGHTHGAGESQIADNIRAITGRAAYRDPEVARVFDF